MKTPEPGIYYDVAFETYLDWDAISASRLKLAARSMAHYHAGFQGQETKAMRLGTLCHTGKLEPLAIAERYAVMPAYEEDEENKTAKGIRTRSKSTLYYKQQAGNFQAANRDKIIVEQSEFEMMRGVVASLSSNPLAVRALSGTTEVSMVWQDKETGLLCKCRHDAINDANQTIGDLKTTADCMWFHRDVQRYQYHLQMAHYRLGVQTLCGESYEPWLVPVEKTAPYGNMAAPVDPQALRIGERLRADRMREIAECIQSNHWPGYDSPESWTVQDESTKPVEVTIGGKTVTI